MTIIRNNEKYELSPQELFEAYQEQQHKNDLDSILTALWDENSYEEDETNTYMIQALMDNAGFAKDVASKYREYVNDSVGKDQQMNFLREAFKYVAAYWTHKPKRYKAIRFDPATGLYSEHEADTLEEINLFIGYAEEYDVIDLENGTPVSSGRKIWNDAMNGVRIKHGGELKKQFATFFDENPDAPCYLMITDEKGFKKLCPINESFRSTVNTDYEDSPPFLAIRTSWEPSNTITVKEMYDSLCAVKKLEGPLFSNMPAYVLFECYNDDDDPDSFEYDPTSFDITGAYMSGGNACVIHAKSYKVIHETITEKGDLVRKVEDAYVNDSVELNSSFFDFDVDMPKQDILEAYAEIQKKINGDIVSYPEQSDNYIGNCKDFLTCLNDFPFDCDRYERFAKNGEKLDFILT